jgi:hypothetical protein
VNVPKSVKNILRTVVSAMVNSDERRSQKMRLLASLSIRAVKLLMSSLDEDTRATQGGGVTSAILSAR